MMKIDKKIEWSDVTIEEFKQINILLTDDELDEEDKALGLVALFSDDDPLQTDFREFRKRLENIQFIGKEIKPAEVKKEYVLGGVKYKLNKNIYNLTTSQYIDYTSYLKNLDSDTLYEDVLSVYLIPDGCKYNVGYDIDETKRIIRNNMPITDALGIYNFFFLFFRNYMQISLHYLRKRMKKMMKRRKKDKKEEIENVMKQLDNLLSVLPH